MINRFIAFFFLIILSPIFIIVGLLIFIQDGFPVFFKQKRVGVNYSFFYIYKFRTMCDHQETELEINKQESENQNQSFDQQFSFQEIEEQSVDLDHIMESLERKINQEYRRFYGG